MKPTFLYVSASGSKWWWLPSNKWGGEGMRDDGPSFVSSKPNEQPPTISL